jgi:hypothetical protein
MLIIIIIFIRILHKWFRTCQLNIGIKYNMYDKDKYKYINKICRAYTRTYTIKTDQTNTITAL